MFKVISAEIKKIVSKPGIYILSVLLALILVLGVFIYNPTEYETNQFELEGNTFVDKYTNFIGGTNYGKKPEYDAKLESAITSIENYTITTNTDSYSQKEYVTLFVNKVEEIYGSYKDCVTDNSYQDHIDNTRLKLVSALEELNSTIESALINSKDGSYSLITSTKNHTKYNNTYKEVLKWAKVSVLKENLKEHFIEFENKYEEGFYSSIKNFKYPTLTDSFVKDYTTLNNGTKLAILTDRLNNIEAEIEENLNTAKQDDKFNTKQASKMDQLANLYADTINTYSNLVKYELIVNAFDILSTKDQLNVLHLSSYSNFNSSSMLVKYDYLFEHNKTDNDYSNPLTIGVSSNKETNAYDYAYFVLKMFSFVIIIYAVMSACHSIAGEIKEGTMRYLAIRPISRVNMFFGKWFAILIMSTILILFSSVISILVGGAVYGFSTQTILTIFNGEVAITLHPIAMIGIYLISMLLELIVYSIIAMLLSVLFKSDLLSMTILIVVYLLNTLLPIFVQGANSWLSFYPFSHLNLYALFGSSIYAVENNFFNLIFGAKVYAGTHAILTISLILLITIAVSSIAIKLFKKKEL